MTCLASSAASEALLINQVQELFHVTSEYIHQCKLLNHKICVQPWNLYCWHVVWELRVLNGKFPSLSELLEDYNHDYKCDKWWVRAWVSSTRLHNGPSPAFHPSDFPFTKLNSKVSKKHFLWAKPQKLPAHLHSDFWCPNLTTHSHFSSLKACTKAAY